LFIQQMMCGAISIIKLPKSNYSSLSSTHITHIRKYRGERIAYARSHRCGGIREHSLDTSLKLYIFPISTQAPRGDDRSAFYGAKLKKIVITRRRAPRAFFTIRQESSAPRRSNLRIIPLCVCALPFMNGAPYSNSASMRKPTLQTACRNRLRFLVSQSMNRTRYVHVNKFEEMTRACTPCHAKRKWSHYHSGFVASSIWCSFSYRALPSPLAAS
jgi:hypothetical protein